MMTIAPPWNGYICVLSIDSLDDSRGIFVITYEML